MPALRQRGDDIGSRQAVADDQYPVMRTDDVERARFRGIGNEPRMGCKACCKPAGRCRRRMAGGDRNDIGFGHAAFIIQDRPAAGMALDTGYRGAAMTHGAIFQQRFQQGGNIIAEKPAPGEEHAVGPICLRIVGDGVARLDPGLEFAHIVRLQAHLGGRNVDAMGWICRVICKAAAEFGARFEDHDDRVLAAIRTGKMIGNARAGNAAADDGDDGPLGIRDRLGLHHGRIIAFDAPSIEAGHCPRNPPPPIVYNYYGYLNAIPILSSRNRDCRGWCC